MFIIAANLRVMRELYVHSSLVRAEQDEKRVVLTVRGDFLKAKITGL